MNNQVLNKKDLRRAARRWLIGISTFNYETQLAPSVVYSIYPCLRKMYPDDEDLKKAINNHFKYYNTMPWISPFVMGAALAIEDEGGIAAMDTVQDFKIGLMGPLSGIGDTIGWAMIPTIFGSIAAYMGQQGNPFGVFLWLAFTCLFMIVRILGYEIGYKQGIKVITNFGTQLNVFTEAVSVLGLTVVGALLSSVVKLSTPLAYTNGDVTMKVQEQINSVMPALLPVLAVGVIYYFMSKKHVKMTKMILFIIVFAMLGAATGILG